MPNTHSELRRHPRYSINRPLLVVNTLSAQKLGTLVNLSEEGLMLLGEEALGDGNVYQVSIAVSTGDSPEDVINIGIECLWVSAADSEDKVWSGHRIIDISETDQILMSALISQMI